MNICEPLSAMMTHIQELLYVLAIHYFELLHTVIDNFA